MVRYLKQTNPWNKSKSEFKVSHFNVTVPVKLTELSTEQKKGKTWCYAFNVTGKKKKMHPTVNDNIFLRE